MVHVKAKIYKLLQRIKKENFQVLCVSLKYNDLYIFVLSSCKSVTGLVVGVHGTSYSTGNTITDYILPVTYENTKWIFELNHKSKVGDFVKGFITINI